MIGENDQMVMPNVRITRYEVETLYHAMLRDSASRQADAECWVDDSRKCWDRRFLWHRLELLAAHVGNDLESDFDPLYREAYAKSHMARISDSEPGSQGWHEWQRHLRDQAVPASDAGAATRSSTPKPNCPKCMTNEHVIKRAEEYDDCWVCWKKNGGCGAKWPDEEPWSKPDGPAAIPGVTMADKLPPWAKAKPIDHKDMPFINDCQVHIQRAKSLEELLELWEAVAERRQEVQDELRPDFTLRKGEFIAAAARRLA
jgi:hypothetical protein